MAQPFPLDSSWELGMRRDYSRDEMPGGTAWNLVNLIPATLQAPLRKRGGWTYVGGAMSPSWMQGLVYAPFSGGAKILGVSGSSILWDVLAPVSIGSLGYSPQFQNPFFYRNKVIFPNQDGSTAIKYYDGSSIAALTGSFTGKYGGVFKDHCVLGGGTAVSNPNRLAFSNAADPTTWDLTLQVWDASFPLKGLGFLGSSILLFEENQTEIIRGSIPPPGGDFVMSKFIDVGCLDSWSIVNWNENVIWASSEGVFMTDGFKITNLTNLGGVANYWRDSFLPLFNNPVTKTIVSAIYRGHLIISIQDFGLGGSLDTLVCDLNRNVWWRFSNWMMTSAVQVHGSPEELYFSTGTSSGQRVAKASSAWSPAAANKNDADGTAVTWTIESAMHRGFMRLHRRWIQSQAIQTWRSLYLDYDMRDAATDNPTIRVSVLDDDPSSSNYTDLTAGVGQPPDPAKTTKWSRIRMLINHPSNGLAYRLQSSNASSDTRIYGIEAEYAGREGSRVR